MCLNGSGAVCKGANYECAGGFTWFGMVMQGALSMSLQVTSVSLISSVGHHFC